MQNVIFAILGLANYYTDDKSLVLVMYSLQG